MPHHDFLDVLQPDLVQLHANGDDQRRRRQQQQEEERVALLMQRRQAEEEDAQRRRWQQQQEVEEERRQEQRRQQQQAQQQVLLAVQQEQALQAEQAAEQRRRAEQEATDQLEAAMAASRAEAEARERRAAAEAAARERRAAAEAAARAEEDRQLAEALAISLRDMGGPAGGTQPLHAGRMNEREAPLAIQPDTPWSDIAEARGCREELAASAGVRAVVPRVASLIGSVLEKFDDVRQHDANARALAGPLTDDELFGIIAYTHDFQLADNEKRGNLYFEMNNALRADSAAARQQMMITWGLTVHYILAGLTKLPDYAGVVLRGVPDDGHLTAQYSLNRLVKWRAFSSSSSSLGAAAGFGTPEDVLIFRIQVTRGKVIRLLSLFQQEDEVLLYPGMKFRVTRAAHAGDDGYTYVDMTEEEEPMLVF